MTDRALQAANGTKFPALQVFSAALKAIKERALQRVALASADAKMETDAQFVITVPAIWTPAAKQLMLNGNL